MCLSSTSAYAASTFIKGADISWLPQMEAHGYKFYNSSGVQQDVLTILKGYGISLGGKWDITAFSSYGSGSAIPGIISDMATIKSRYGKPVMQVEFGGPVSKPSQVDADLTTYIKGVKGFGGLGVFYWEPEGYAPFTNYTLGAWNSTTKCPTVALNGFLNA